MTKTPRTFRYLYLMLISVSCTYEPDETFFQEIPQPEHRITFSLNDHDEADTIYLFGPADFTYNVGITPGRIEKVEVTLDGKPLSTSQNHSKFSIEEYQLETGIFELKIQFTSNSGSGSLLDVVGGEKLEVSRRWVVKIDVSPPPKPVVTLKTENGFLRVSWTPYTKPNFTKYVLSISRQFEPFKTITITDASRTSWIDSAYLGGREVSYSLYTYAVGTAHNQAARNDKLQITVEYRTADSTATVVWNKAKFPGALESYEIWENDVLREVITDPADTTRTLKLNPIWNMRSAVSIKYKPKYSTYIPLYYKEFFNTISLPRLSVNAGELQYSPTVNNIIGRRSSYLVFFDSELQAVDSILTGLGFFVPYSGPYIYYSTGASVVRHNMITDDDAVVGTFTNPRNIQGTANGIVSYSYYLNGQWRSRVYDYDSDTFIEQSEHPNWVTESVNPSISTMGTFLFFPISHEVRRIEGLATSLVGTVGNGYAFRSFRADNDDEYIADGVVYSSNTLASLRKLMPAGGDFSFHNYDPVSGYAIFTDSGTVGVYAVHVETLETRVISAFGNQRYQLVAGYLFDDDHNYIKVF